MIRNRGCEKRMGMCRGFTLVELLIVIVVIGILTTMMMLSATEMAASADATAIIANLHNWKTAALEWYADNMDRVDIYGHILDGGNIKRFRYNNGVPTSEIAAYLNNQGFTVGDSVVDDAGGIYYTDYLNNNGKDTNTDPCEWVILYKMPDESIRLKEKLEARAKSTGLIRKDAEKEGEYSDPYKQGNSDVFVGVKILNFGRVEK